jgi:hypothetical protein
VQFCIQTFSIFVINKSSMAKTLLIIFFFCAGMSSLLAQAPSANHDSIPRAKKEASRPHASANEVKEALDRNHATIFPNPAGALATIEYSLPASAKSGKLVIYNILGSISKEVILSRQEGRVEINTSQLSPGVYFYSLELDGVKQSTKRLVIRH